MASVQQKVEGHQSQAMQAWGALETEQKRIAACDLYSDKAKEELTAKAEGEYSDRIATLKELAEYDVDTAARRIVELRRDAREAEEKRFRDLLGDSLAATVYAAVIDRPSMYQA